jgi:glycosyltransferase involved in cell wall biosynthesis
MKILLLSRYGYLGASSRYRSYQYLPYLDKNGCDITVLPLLDNDYLQQLYSKLPISVNRILRSYLQRVFLLIKSSRYDLIWLEKEAFPWIPEKLESLLLKSDVPYVVDYDDAVFHQYDQHTSGLIRWLLGNKLDFVMGKAAIVIAGNDYLAERAQQAGAPRVEILPTVIDLERYPLMPLPKHKNFTIGWIGSPSSAKYLTTIAPALSQFCQENDARLVLIGSGELELPGVPVEIKAWSEETEVNEMRQFDVGIMPINETGWSRGKCGFKLIQYMACGLPVIASPIGANCQIVEEGINGFFATSTEDWVRALSTLQDNYELRESMGKAGRLKVENQYCTQVAAPRLLSLLQSVVKEFK